jgi:DNA-binding transcriptional regulator GbsR (MarR family)
MSGTGKQGAILHVQRLCKRFGFSDSMSKLMAHLMLEQRPMSIEDLMAETGVSRTSVSTALSALESRFLVTKEKKRRVGYYVPNVDFAKLIADQPVKVLEEEIKPLISLLEILSKEARDKEQQRSYGSLLAQLKGSASTLRKIIDCLSAAS